MVAKEKNIDAVAIFTPAPDHVKHVKMCMEKGWHVCSAVPACLSLAEAQELKELKERTGLKYMMAESSYFHQDCIFARNLFKEGKFGELFYSEVEYYHTFADIETYDTAKDSLVIDRNGKPVRVKASELIKDNEQ